MGWVTTKPPDPPVRDTIATSEPAPGTNHMGPAAARVHRPSPAWTDTVALRLYMAAVFCIPVQLELERFRSVIDSRLSPGDVFLALSVILAPASFRLSRRPLGLLPLALPLTLGYGAIVAIVLQGTLTRHSLNVKFMGSFVLVVMGVVTFAYAREGYAARILRSLLAGVAVWGVVGCIDWRVADVFPWLQHEASSRFTALQFDPNNAGAMFAVALLVSWRYGRHLFPRRWVWLGLTTWFGVALGLTFSRGAYIGTATAVAVVLVVDRFTPQRWMRHGVAALVIGAFLLVTGFVEAAADDISHRPDTVESRNSLAGTAVDRWVDSRGLGMGLGTFRAETAKSIHNTGIWLVTEMSLPGLLFFIAVIVVPFQACLRFRAYDHELAMALLAAHITMVVASTGIEGLYQRSWWLIIGLTILPTVAVREAQRAAVLTQVG